MSDTISITEDKLNIAVTRFKLTCIEKIYAQNSHAVYSAKSSIYGDVILKINDDIPALAHEYFAIHSLNGIGCCRAYGFDKSTGLLLEERIIPGTVLREEKNADKRIEIFAEIFNTIHHKRDGLQLYGSYKDWVHRACDFIQWQNNAAILKQKMITAKDIANELFDKYIDRVLLHGDCHHDNILRKDTGYVVIDPKGVVGPAIFDIPRFIMNELDPDINSTGKEHIEYVISQIAAILNYPADDIRKLFFMEVMLGNTWNIEDGGKLFEGDVEIATEIFSQVR